jgi:hypothetical protein
MPCSSGTAALHIAVAAAGIGPSDEVITSPITDIGTVIGVIYQQGVPVFADLGEDVRWLLRQVVEFRHGRLHPVVSATQSRNHRAQWSSKDLIAFLIKAAIRCLARNTWPIFTPIVSATFWAGHCLIT